MRSTFMGLETSKRGMFTQQTALYTTGHNLSNANTIGYSRQRVNMEATTPYPGIGLNSGTAPGFIGTGSQAHSVQRIRDQFVDRQFRQEANSLGYWDTKAKAISQMEDVLNEPTEFGINETLDLFWKSLSLVGADPQSAGTRNVAIERGVNAAESFNHVHKQIFDLQLDVKSEINISTLDVNSILKQIAELNHSIQKIEPNGYMPNDLYDARDVLIDELAQYFPIEVSYRKTGGNSLAIAEGIVDISIKTKTDSIKVVEGKEASQLAHNMAPNNSTDPFQNFTIKSGPSAGTIITQDMMLPGNGTMLSHIDSYGYDNGKGPEGMYPDMLKQLNEMAKEFAEKFNEVHKQGFGLQTEETDPITGLPVIDPITGLPVMKDSETGHSFFAGGPPITANNIVVNQDILDDPNKFAASSAINEEGNGDNAFLLAGVKDVPIINCASVQTYYETLIGGVGVKGEQANRMAETSATKLLTIANGRAQVSSVSVDEEMTNMITFQQAYNASARMLTAVDEVLDRIINGMGRVGQ